eukprot:COSAG05_NODE_11548_length_508_cov_0.880196_1_plen_26_part_10
MQVEHSIWATFFFLSLQAGKPDMRDP